MSRVVLAHAARPIKRIANSPTVLFYTVLGTWLTAALLFTLLEPVGFFDSLYWSMTTMTTVGYGDLSAASASGKVLTMAFQAWSIFVLVPCAVANIYDSVRIDEHKMTHEEQEWLFSAIEEIAKAEGKSLPPQPENY